MKGEIIIVRDVMKSERKRADYVIFLKCINSIPKPITVKSAVIINRLLNKVPDEKLKGKEELVMTLYSLAHP